MDIILDRTTTSPPSETTEVLYGNDNIIKKTLETFSWIKERLESSIDNAGPAIHVMPPVWTGLVQLKEKGVKIRGVTEITPNNIMYCKRLMEVCELRHLDGVRTNFGIADGEVALLHGVSQETYPLSQAIFTSVKGLVEAQEFLFENLWKDAIQAQDKIREIEEGVKPPFIETLKDPFEIQKLALGLVKSAKQEIQMLLLPTTNNIAFLKDEHAQITLLKEVANRQISVRILTSEYVYKRVEKVIEEQKVKMIKDEQEEAKDDAGLVAQARGKLQIHVVDMLQQQQRLQTNVSSLIVDSKVCLVEDLKPYNNSSEGHSLATYSNSESTVLTYSSIFETLWAQTELKIQKDC